MLLKRFFRFTPSTSIKKLVLVGSTATLVFASIPFVSLLSPNNNLVQAQENILCNCVKYARSRVPSLPTGLWTLEDKKRTINSQAPSIGSVAIMDIYKDIGHVAVVTDVLPDGQITVEEGNYRRCKFTRRTGLPGRMGVVGYFRP